MSNNSARMSTTGQFQHKERPEFFCNRTVEVEMSVRLWFWSKGKTTEELSYFEEILQIV